MEAFKVQVRVLSKQFRVRQGARARMFRSPQSTRFLIGSSPDAVICCSQADLHPEHCWVVIAESGVFVQPHEDAVAILNDTPITGQTAVAHGDVLQLAALELELRIQAAEQAAPVDAVAPRRDAVSEEISDWLMAEDEAERVRRRSAEVGALPDYDARFTQLDDSARRATKDKKDKEEAAADETKSKRSAAPGKLPPPTPPPPAASSELAAEDALKNLFTRRGEQRSSDSSGSS